MKKKYNKKKGFTFIELLVAVTIFSITILAASALFTSAIRGQRTTLISQELLDQSSYAIEYMSRALRIATKELNCSDPLDPATCDPSNPPHCLTNKGYGWNYETNPPDYDKIKFINHLQDNDCQEFFLENSTHRIKYKTGEGEFYLTSDDIRVNFLKFDLSGEYQGEPGNPDNLQPRLTILLEVERKGPTPTENPKIKIQTSISQRNLDVQY